MGERVCGLLHHSDVSSALPIKYMSYCYRPLEVQLLPGSECPHRSFRGKLYRCRHWHENRTGFHHSMPDGVCLAERKPPALRLLEFQVFERLLIHEAGGEQKGLSLIHIFGE